MDGGGWVGGGFCVEEGRGHVSTSARITPTTPPGPGAARPPTSCRRCRCERGRPTLVVGGWPNRYVHQTYGAWTCARALFVSLSSSAG